MHATQCKPPAPDRLTCSEPAMPMIALLSCNAYAQFMHRTASYAMPCYAKHGMAWPRYPPMCCAESLASLWRSLLCQVFLLSGTRSLMPGEYPRSVNNICMTTDLLEHVFTCMLIHQLTMYSYRRHRVKTVWQHCLICKRWGVQKCALTLRNGYLWY